MSAVETSDEEWRPIEGYERIYEVSSHGRVRSLDRDLRFLHYGKERRVLQRGRVLARPPNSAGYPVVCLTARPRKAVLATVHRLVCLAFHVPPPAGCETGHLDGDTSNSRADNLAWVTKVQNQAHRLVHGTDHRGEKSPLHKLSADDVIRIRDLGNAMPPVRIAELYDMDRSHISAIVRGRARPYG